MRTCFCGCDRKIPRFPLGSRSANTRGRLVAERLLWFSAVWNELEHEADSETDNLENWFAEGAEGMMEIRAMLHGELDPSLVDPRTSNHWLKYGRGVDRVSQGFGFPTLNRWLRAQQGKQQMIRELVDALLVQEALTLLGETIEANRADREEGERRAAHEARRGVKRDGRERARRAREKEDG